MESIESDIKTPVVNLECILGNSLTIPAYQRPYEWKEEQVTRCFEQIKEDFSKKRTRTFLGTIQFVYEDSTYMIIDGQQRLTTLFLLCHSLKSDFTFSFVNKIDKEYEEKLKQTLEKNEGLNDNPYSKNLGILSKLVDKINDKDSFYDYIMKNVHFVAILTSSTETKIEEVMDIFDALNTSGLPLERKDVFKIRLTKALSKPDEVNRINNAYKDVLNFERMYFLSEDDLLNALKYYDIVLEYDSNQISGNLIKQSYSEYFSEKIDSRPDKIKSELINLASCMKETQEILSKLDQKKDFQEHKLLLLSKELLAWSGYGRLKNLFYVIVLCLAKEPTKINEKIVEEALTHTQELWRYCAIHHTIRIRTINEVYGKVGMYIKKISNAELTDGILSVDKDTVESFLKAISGDILSNNRKDLLIVLSYISETQDDAKEIKGKFFYYEKWDWDIEHIISKKFSKVCSDLLNSSGNLMYIERKINEAMGQRTKDIKDVMADKASKLDSNAKKSYHDSQLSTVKNVINSLEKVETAEQFVNYISERQNQKIEALRKCFGIN